MFQLFVNNLARAGATAYNVHVTLCSSTSWLPATRFTGCPDQSATSCHSTRRGGHHNLSQYKAIIHTAFVIIRRESAFLLEVARKEFIPNLVT